MSARLSDPEVYAETAEAAEPGEAQPEVTPFTTAAGWWATMAREWANKELISYLANPDARQQEAERVVLDFEAQQAESERYLATMNAAADLANENTAKLTTEGLAEVERGWRAAMIPLRVSHAFDVVKHRVSMIMNDFRQRVTTMFTGEVTVEITRTDLPAIESGPAALPPLPPPPFEPPDDEETAAWANWVNDDTGDVRAPTDTLEGLIPSMGPRQDKTSQED